MITNAEENCQTKQRYEEGDPSVRTLGQHSEKFDYFVEYMPPPGFGADIKDIVPTGWGESDDNFPADEVPGFSSR